MKSPLSVSRKEHLIQTSRTRFYFNYHITLELYSIYKAESEVKKEPRIPLNDPRRSEPARKHRVALTSYLKQQITSCISLIRASGNNLHHNVASLLRN